MKRAQEEWKHDIVYYPKRSQGHKSLVPYFMTPKVTVTLVVGLTYFMTPKGHGFMKDRRDLLYDPKRSR